MSEFQTSFTRHSSKRRPGPLHGRASSIRRRARCWRRWRSRPGRVKVRLASAARGSREQLTLWGSMEKIGKKLQEIAVRSAPKAAPRSPLLPLQPAELTHAVAAGGDTGNFHNRVAVL